MIFFPSTMQMIQLKNASFPDYRSSFQIMHPCFSKCFSLCLRENALLLEIVLLLWVWDYCQGYALHNSNIICDKFRIWLFSCVLWCLFICKNLVILKTLKLKNVKQTRFPTTPSLYVSCKLKWWRVAALWWIFDSIAVQTCLPSGAFQLPLRLKPTLPSRGDTGIQAQSWCQE